MFQTILDLERYEPLSGEQGMPGSTYRLVSKDMTFVVTVVSRTLPDRVSLFLDSDSVTVSIDVEFAASSPRSTRLVSTEIFRFKGLLRRVFGLLARSSIHSVHRRQMEAFKRFAETRAG